MSSLKKRKKDLIVFESRSGPVTTTIRLTSPHLTFRWMPAIRSLKKVKRVHKDPGAQIIFADDASIHQCLGIASSLLCSSRISVQPPSSVALSSHGFWHSFMLIGMDRASIHRRDVHLSPALSCRVFGCAK